MKAVDFDMLLSALYLNLAAGFGALPREIIIIEESLKTGTKKCFTGAALEPKPLTGCRAS